MKYEHLEAFIGKEEAELLRSKTVSVVGLGGIGSAIVDLIVRSGINVRVIEKGRVEDEDMDRLSLFSTDDISKFKATQAKKKLAKINPDSNIKSFNEEITKETLFLIDSDLVIDCSSNEELSPLISEYCFKNDMPCISARIRSGRVIVSFSNDKKDAYSQVESIKTKKTEGLFPAATHMAAGFMYTKAIKLLLGQKPKRGVVIYNVWDQCFEDKRGNKK